MTPSQSLSWDDAPREARRDAPAYGSATTAPRRTWPVLARVGELPTAAEREPGGNRPSAAVRRTYRIDSPHVTLASPPAPDLRPDATNDESAAPSPPPARRSKRYLHRLPGIIRFAIGTWLLLNPYRSLIRAAVMFVLMAVTGASTMIIVGDQMQPSEATPSASTTAADRATGESEPHPAVLAPVIEPMSPPEASTTLLAPTANGPATRQAPRDVATTSREPAYQGKVPSTGGGGGADESDAALAHSSPWSPPEPGRGVPRVQTSERPPGVARLEGTIEHVLPPR